MRDDPAVPGLGPDGVPFLVHAQVDRERGRGALLGLACGDALGTTLEFSSPAVPEFPKLATGPHREVVGCGPFQLRAGQVTDDTQMATALATSLMKCGMFEMADVANRYVSWESVAFDVGAQTRNALLRVGKGSGPEQAGYDVWVESGCRAAGNGSLMRTLPIGLFFAGQRGDLLDAALGESSITHADPRCQLACAAYDAAIAVGARELAGPREMASEAVAALEDAAQRLASRMKRHAGRVRGAHADLADDLRAAMTDDPQLTSDRLHIHRHAGFVRVAFRLAFWHLLHTPSFEDALVDVVNRGGDADTNGAIAGGLLGAAHGESAIPVQWRERVLAALDDEEGPLATTYNPRTLLRLVE
jgi:ADP-ribosylglycohydrolase